MLGFLRAYLGQTMSQNYKISFFHNIVGKQYLVCISPERDIIFIFNYVKAEAVGTRPPRSSLAPRRPGFGSQYAETDLDSIFTSTPSFNQVNTENCYIH